ncbi:MULTISPECIES: helix-turn-helix domain-containing protein [Nocardia]|uniref:helix-turn-helix domain-containing protein n=1 Tax=Nocardia TaxID=1817 RepID=UPI0002E06B3A|nr:MULTISPECIES: helix-turn-helix transcriptional regulator [Nocardia]MCC3332889.1 helix-turn-helix transcriptional regulator [Nocardia abscessus]MDE1674912.1 helix-turn-helix transcriptional regulator [Nocardia gipuzkoensis]
MQWNLRLAAANRGIWQASQLQQMLAEHGLVISAGKMSHLWSGQPASIKLGDLDVLCAVLRCEVGELLIAQPLPTARPADEADTDTVAVNAPPPVIPRRRDGRSLPPR